MAVIKKNVFQQLAVLPNNQYLRNCLPELLLLLVVAIASTLIFWFFPLDLVVSGWLRTAKHGINWPIALHEPWLSLNRMGDKFLTILLLSVPIVIIVGSLFMRRCRKLRYYALFILATVIIGPGLLVNVVCKDHLGRPRPKQIECFGGKYAYVPPLAKGPAGKNSSFPSGHASVAFCYIVFWFIWRRRHPRLAVIALVGSLTLGGIMSFARMASGDHFLSDVLWSGYLCYFSALILYYFILPIPQNRSNRGAPVVLGDVEGIEQHL